MKPASKHLAYWRLREGMAAPGCPLCRIIAAAVTRYLDGLLHESVNDSKLRQRLRAARGFCNRHAWQLQQRGNPLALSILWRDLLAPDAASLDARQRPRRARPALCPACEVAAEAQQRYLAVLLEHVADDLADAYRDGPGLCLPHLRLALAAAPAAVSDFLVSSEREKLDRLCRQLGEIIRKHDYRFRREPWGPEKDAWIRATAKVAGEPPDDVPACGGATPPGSRRL